MNSLDLKQKTLENNNQIRKQLQEIETVASYLPRFSRPVNGFEIKYRGIERITKLLLSEKRHLEHFKIQIEVCGRKQALELLERFAPARLWLHSNDGEYPFRPDFNGNGSLPSQEDKKLICPVRLFFSPDRQKEVNLSWFSLMSNAPIRAHLEVQIFMTDFIFEGLKDDSKTYPSEYFENIIWYEKTAERRTFILHNFPTNAQILWNQSSVFQEYFAFWNEPDLNHFAKSFLEKADTQITLED